jgi:hypothetical protein
MLHRAPPLSTVPEGATSPSEGGVYPGPVPDSVSSDPVLSDAQQESSSRSQYWDEELPEKRRRKPNPKYTHHLSSAKVRLGDLNQSVLMGLDWAQNHLQPAPTYYSRMMALFQLATDPFTNEIDGDQHPCLLSSKASQSDNPTYEEAINGPHRDGFHQAMVMELKTLTDMECWDVVERVPRSNFLPSTWALKMKRYPDGRLSKYKARFCAGGHRQIEGVDFFETFAPVVNWTTFRLYLSFHKS